MPALSFAVGSARAEHYTAVPVLTFRLAIREASGMAVHAILLHVQIQIQPRRRRYSADEEERLADLFGAPERWSETLRPLHWNNATVLVPAFASETEIDLTVPCTYDLEV